jgi:MYXO-CTERM domain-containing protein
MRSLAAATTFALTLASANAYGAADAGPGDDVDSLLKQLQQDYSALSTQDCTIACKAYASIRRAADRICGLEPGPRCNDARTKADDAQRRVQAACPDCQIAAAPGKEDERRAVQTAPPPTPTESKTGGAADSEAAPRKGGCASCSTPGEKPLGDLGIAFVGAFVVARVLRRRKRA